MKLILIIGIIVFLAAVAYVIYKVSGDSFESDRGIEW